MVKLSDEFIFQLKTNCDISSVVSNYVNLKFSGKNRKGCCPFHSEKTPSFFVFEDTQSFYCFGCGVGGDVITFIKKIENLEYVEAVELLCKMVGMSLPVDEDDEKKMKYKQKMLEINRCAARFFFNNLKTKEGKKGLDYLVKVRKLNKEVIIKCGLGYALNGWTTLKDHLREKGFTYEEIRSCDLIVKSKNLNYYDRFRNRVIFPIIDLKGDVVAFGGRSLGEGQVPKYLNSSDTLIFKKSFCVFALNFAKTNSFKNIILCEGYLDVISLHKYGFDNAVATLGTSITKEQARLISRSFKDVILAYDSDEAGRLATKKASSLFEELGIKTKTISFNKAKDPDEYITKNGVLKFKNIIEKADSFEKLEFSQLLNKYDLNNLEERKKYISEYCSILAEMKDPLKRDIYIGQLCNRLNLERYVIKNHIKYILSRKKRDFDKNIYKKFIFKFKNDVAEKGKIPLKVLRAEEGILRFLYFNQDMFFEFKDELNEEIFNVIYHKKIFKFMSELINLKKNFSFSVFHEVLDDEEISRFSKIINSKYYSADVVLEFKDYLKVLKKYLENKKEDVSVLSLKELEEKRKEKANFKR